MAAAICAAVLATYPYASSYAGRMATCLYVVNRAEASGYDPSLVASLAWHESRFKWSARSPGVGALGPLQVRPEFWCKEKKKKCDLVQAGFKALSWWMSRADDKGIHWCSRGWQVHGICRFNAGYRCGKRSRRWAEAVIALAEKLRRTKWNHS